MKKFKKLVPAFCMLLLSAVMLASGTFAWFSVNDRVSATGMQVEAKANTQFLVIANALTGDKFNSNSDTTAFAAATGGVEAGQNNVYPVFRVTADDKNGTETVKKVVLKDGEKINTLENQEASATPNGTEFVVGNWYTANSTAYDAVNGTDAAGDREVRNVKEVKLEAGEYFLEYTAYVGLAKNSADFSGKLTIACVNENDASAELASAIKYAIVLTPYVDGVAQTAKDAVVCNRAGEDFNGISLKTGADGNGVDFVKLTVYLYVDGFDGAVKDSMTELKGKLGLSITAIAG